MTSLRGYATPIAVVAALILVWLQPDDWPISRPEGTLNTALTIVFWVLSLVVVGALTGIAAFFGALMNMSFLLAGSASTNPVLFTAAIGLMLAWRVAGWYGLDRWLLPMLGTPWRAQVNDRRTAPGAT